MSIKKTVVVKYLVTNQPYDVEIEIDKRVSDLKKKIEDLLGIKLINKLMIKHKQQRNQKSLEDENKTIEDARIHNGDIITIAKTDVLGG